MINMFGKHEYMLGEYKFASWNVHSIRDIERKKALKWVDDNCIDILALQEIKSTKEQIPENLFKREFRNLYVNSSSEIDHSGVAVYSDADAYYEGVCDNVDILDEGRINEIHFELEGRDVAYLNVYFPNARRNSQKLKYKMEFCDRFLEHCENLKKQGKSIIICGDLNTAHTELDLAQPKKNRKTPGFLPKERDWLTKFLSHGYIDTLRLKNGLEPGHYTWWSYKTQERDETNGWRTDYFFVSEDLKEYVLDAYILEDTPGSDHWPTILMFKF